MCRRPELATPQPALLSRQGILARLHTLKEPGPWRRGAGVQETSEGIDKIFRTYFSTMMEFHPLTQIKGPYEPIVGRLPRFGNTGDHVEVCIELYKPIKHLLSHQGTVYVRDENWIQCEWFLPDAFTIYPTVSRDGCEMLILAFSRLFLIPTSHSKGYEPITEVGKHPAPRHWHHSSLTHTACAPESLSNPSGHEASSTHYQNEKGAYISLFTPFGGDLQAHITHRHHRHRRHTPYLPD